MFFTQLSRIATRKNISPVAITLQALPKAIKSYEVYFGCQLTLGEAVSISFDAEDTRLPLLTSNLSMWEFFEQKLNQKLADVGATATTTERVMAVFIEAIPSGKSNIERVASELADYYLQKSTLSLCEISFLLGSSESNSFIRAYSGWKGVSPGQYREQCH